MTPNELAAALREHNAWRRGEGKYDGDPSLEPMPHTPKQLGEIIEQAAAALEAYEAKAMLGKKLANIGSRWLKAHYALQDGINSFELHNDTVMEARTALDDFHLTLEEWKKLEGEGK